MATVPLAWRGAHPWGPTANAARMRGELEPRFYDARMSCWAAFGRQHLQDGDILFRKGRCYFFDGACSSSFFADISDSPFSHEGIVHWQDGAVWVYDVDGEGVRDIPFEFWMLTVAQEMFAIRRLKAPYRDRIPQVLAFCREQYLQEIPYDRTFGSGDARLYCSELVEKAFRSAGLALSEPVAISRLPNFDRYRALGPLVEALTPIRLTTPVFVPGNASYGTYASPFLEPVYESTAVTEALKTRTRPVS
jgi:hypothetical protein